MDKKEDAKFTINIIPMEMANWGPNDNPANTVNAWVIFNKDATAIKA